MKLSMMVVMTSWAWKRALSHPQSAPSSAAVATPQSTAAIRPSPAGDPESAEPATAMAKAPAITWPSAPMLNSPARSPRATESPVKMSGVDL